MDETGGVRRVDPAADGKNKSYAKKNSSRHTILGLLMLCITCTLSSVVLSHWRFDPFRQWDRYHYEHNHLPPQTRRQWQRAKAARINTKNDRRLRNKQNTFDGEQITAILRGEKPFPNNAPNILKYRPGNLQMSSAEALQYCYVNVTKYENHMKAGPRFLVSASDHHKLYYRNIPKSASSSSRVAMETYLHGEDTRIKIDDLIKDVNKGNHELVSFIREPLNRFYSSYDEAHYRWGPWMGSKGSARSRPMVHKNYHKFKHTVLEKYPFIYDGMESIRDFRRLYCPEEVMKGGGNPSTECNEVQSIDDGTLTRLFERFVQEYDGDPFDVHLSLQVPQLVDGRNGQPLPVSKLYNATEAEKGWRAIAENRGVVIPEDGLEHGRKITRRFNVAKVSAATRQKICQLMALDYCCLNIELPEVCRMEENEGVYCAMEKRHQKREKPRLVIQPWNDVQNQ